MPLTSLSLQENTSGWRDRDAGRVLQLKTSFEEGRFGRTVACGVQILDFEDNESKKLIDDGFATVEALKEIMAVYHTCPDKKPLGGTWDPVLIDIFIKGLPVKVVRYRDDSDRSLREQWNTIKHDEESHNVRWSSVYQKVKVTVAIHLVALNAVFLNAKRCVSKRCVLCL